MQTASNKRSGVAAVEFAVVLPLLLVLLVGVWEVGRMVEVKQILTNAAREGGRQASTGHKTFAEVKEVVVDYLRHHGITAQTSEVTVLNKTSSGRDPTVAEQLDRFEVTVTIPFNRVAWVIMDRITTLDNLVGEAQWYSMRDIAITVDDEIPLE